MIDTQALIERAKNAAKAIRAFREDDNEMWLPHEDAIEAEDTLLAVVAALSAQEDEIAEAREACPSVRLQDNFDAPLLKLVNLEVSRGFNRDAEVARLAALLATQDQDLLKLAALAVWLGASVDADLIEVVGQHIDKARAVGKQQAEAAQEAKQQAFEAGMMEACDHPLKQEWVAEAFARYRSSPRPATEPQ